MGEFNRLVSKDPNLNGNFSQGIQSAIKLKINSYTQNLEDEVNQALKQMDQFEKSSFTQEGYCIWDNPRRLWLEPQFLVCRNIKCKNPECFTFLNIVLELDSLLEPQHPIRNQEIQKFVILIFIKNDNFEILKSKFSNLNKKIYTKFIRF